MSIAKEQLLAYADGELGVAEAAVVEAALAADPALAAQLAAHRALRERLSAHFAPILDEPVPDRLSALIPSAGGGADVIDFAAAAAERASGRAAPPRRWLPFAGAALAASLVLGVVLTRPGSGGDGYAAPGLSSALDTQLAAAEPGGSPYRILVSFPGKAGTLCRGYGAAAESGIACRDQRGWKIEQRFPGFDIQGTDYRQAGSEGAALLKAAQDMASGEALDAAGEVQARSRGWRR